MKKVILSLLIISLNLVMSGCMREYEPMTDEERAEYEAHRDAKLEEWGVGDQDEFTNGSGRSTSEEAQYIADAVKKSFETKDIQPLKSVLRKDIQEIENIDEQLKALVNYFDGTSFTYERKPVRNGGGTKNNFIWEELSVGFSFDTVETNTGRNYSSLSVGFTYADPDTNKLGVYSIMFYEPDIEETPHHVYRFSPLEEDFLINADRDGLPIELENMLGTDDTISDTDADGVHDFYEMFPPILTDDPYFKHVLGEDIAGEYLKRNILVLTETAIYHNISYADEIKLYDIDYDGYLSDEEYTKFQADYPDYPSYLPNK